MMKTIFFMMVLFIVVVVVPTAAQVADSTKPKSPDKEALKFAISEDGKHFFQVTFLNQTWVRWNESNPGTTLFSTAAPSTLDIGLRRTRIQMMGQITDKVFLYFQFGMNNFNRTFNVGANRKNAAFFHDAVCEYKVTNNNALKLGGGLTIANGLSRFSQPSIGTILTMDVPVFAQATVDQTDQFSRKFSVYARGQWKKFDYRFSFSDPFPITSNGVPYTSISKYSNFAQYGHKKQYQGYVMYQFYEHEGHLTPYMAGTYLGKKKVFNVAAGAISQANAMWNLENAKDTVYHNILLICVESYLDMPLNKEKGTAVSAYAGYFNYNFGPDYLRYNGIMNPATGVNNLNSVKGAGAVQGNAFPMFGTGQLIYTQAAYLLPKNVLPEGKGQLQPYVSATMGKYQRLGSNSTNVYNVGLNWLITGHKAKLSLDYQNRPIYLQNTSGDTQSAGRRSCVVLQYQIFI